METIFLDPNNLELEAINEAEDGSALTYRISTWDIETRDRLATLVEKGETVAFEIDPLRFEGMVQNETTEEASAAPDGDMTFIVNIRIVSEQPVVTPNCDA